jgi:prepilin-type N-terminal cleavage/methylation domain-containing protein
MLILKKNQGLTLIELLIGMAIMVLMLAGIVEIFQITNSSYQRTMYQAQSVPNVNTALASISNELRAATSIAISADTKTINYTNTSGQSASIGFNPATKAIDFKLTGTTTKSIGASIVQDLKFSQSSGTIQVQITYNASGKAADAVTITSDIATNGTYGI